VRLGPAFRVDPALSRRVRLRDLVLAAALALGPLPTLLLCVGYAARTLGHDNSAIKTLGEYLLALGGISIATWTGIPVAILIGALATRSGWIGWASAPGAGFLGGAVMALLVIAIDGSTYPPDLIFIFSYLFVPAGVVYGLLGWAALRWLRPDVYLTEPR